MTMQQRPTLTQEEIATLHGHEQSLAHARSVLDDLEAIGVDVSSHRQLLDQTETMRRGLLDRFTNTQYIAPPARRARGK